MPAIDEGACSPNSRRGSPEENARFLWHLDMGGNAFVMSVKPLYPSAGEMAFACLDFSKKISPSYSISVCDRTR